MTDLAKPDLPNIQNLIRRGALGLMNNRTAGSYSPTNSYATLGARERAFGSANSGLVLRSLQPYEQSSAGKVFQRRTGQPVPDTAFVVLDLPQLLRNNAKVSQTVDLGFLGSLLAAQGRKTAVVGNADADGPGREFALTLMNRHGLVPMGHLQNGLQRTNPLKPFGRETDYTRLLKTVVNYTNQADVIGVELGDTSRVEKYRDALTPARYSQLAQAALQDLDAFVGLTNKAFNSKQTLILWIAPFPSSAALKKGDSLLPVIAEGPGFASGILYSPATRWPGIISGFDLQATILSHLEVPLPPELMGRPLSYRPRLNSLSYLQTENNRIVAVNNTRGPVLKGFVVVQIILVLFALVVILTRPGRPRLYTGLSSALTGITALPLALLLHPLLGFHGVFWEALYLLGFTIATGVLTHRMKAAVNHILGGIALLTAFAISTDILAGSPLMRYSLLGFGPIGGSRYYGIGNEYMGILLGASLTGTAMILDRFTAFCKPVLVLTTIFYGLLILAVGGPWLGSNVGGGIALTVAYMVMLLLHYKGDLRRGRLLGLAFGVAILLVATMGLIDLLRGGTNQSHLGRLAQLVNSSGISSALPIIARKIQMNLKLIEYTIWTKALLTFIIVLWVLFYRPRGKLAEMSGRFPSSFKGFWSAVVGSAAALLANDSGIVSAATALLYPVVQMIQIVLADPAPAHDRFLVDKTRDKL